MNRRLRPRILAVAVTLMTTFPAAVALAQQATHTVTFGVTFANRTSLTTSSSVLEVPQVALDASGSAVVGTIEFQAAARTRGDGEVVLTVEALRDIGSLTGGGPANAAVAIEFSGTDAGVVPGALSDTPQVAGRWVGPGLRRGQLTFTLRGTGRVSGGVIPLRFVLSAP